MTRLLYRTALALLLTANAAALALLVADGHGLPPLLGAVTLAYVGLVVLGYALGAAWHVGRADACRWHHRKQRPTRHPAIRGEVVAKQQQHAEAMAAVEADAPLPERTPSPTVSFTAVMPTVVSGVAWGFGPHGGGVGEPQQQPWTAPVSKDAAQHAGMPAELAAFDWEPSGALSP